MILYRKNIDIVENNVVTARHRKISLLGVLILLIAFPAVASANAGLPMIAVGAPFMLGLLIPVLLIEFFVYYKKTDKGASSALIATAAANIYSTLIGYPLSWALLLGYQIAASYLFMLLNKIGLDPVAFLIPPSYATAFFSPAWILPFNFPVKLLICLAGIAGLIPAYYISVSFEYSVLKKMWGADETVKSACLLANRLSYAMLLLVLIALFFYYYVQESLLF